MTPLDDEPEETANEYLKEQFRKYGTPMTTPSAALVESKPCECGPIGLARLFASEAFRRGAASVRELDASDMMAQGQYDSADKQLKIATELRK